MQKIVLLVNPRANKGETIKKVPEIARLVAEQGWEAETVVPTSEAETIAYVSSLPAQTVVIALGGDGFLARVCEGAVKSQVTVLPLPGGRGNDFCKALGIPNSIPDALTLLPKLRKRRIDVGLANGKLFLGVASVGFTSIADHWATETTLPLGAFVYTAAGIVTFFRIKKPFQFKITVDGEVFKRKAWATEISLSGRYGGGMTICNESKLDDGLLEAITLSSEKKFELVKALRDAFKGNVLEREGIWWKRGKKFLIETPEEIVVHADGDELGVTPLMVEVLPNAVTLLAP